MFHIPAHKEHRAAFAPSQFLVGNDTPEARPCGHFSDDHLWRVYFEPHTKSEDYERALAEMKHRGLI